jgi:hypothetical protein
VKKTYQSSVFEAVDIIGANAIRCRHLAMKTESEKEENWRWLAA